MHRNIEPWILCPTKNPQRKISTLLKSYASFYEQLYTFVIYYGLLKKSTIGTCHEYSKVSFANLSKDLCITKSVKSFQKLFSKIPTSSPRHRYSIQYNTALERLVFYNAYYVFLGSFRRYSNIRLSMANCTRAKKK